MLLWALGEPELIEPGALAAITDAEHSVLVSSVAIWELEIKRATKKLTAPDDMIGQAVAAGFAPLFVTWEHGVAAGRLPLHHGDPFDRMLVAQAQVEGLTLVTRDAKLARYDVEILPA